MTVRLEPAEDGWWVATVPEYPGAVSQGRSREEARSMVIDALGLLMAAHRERAERTPLSRDEPLAVAIG